MFRLVIFLVFIIFGTEATDLDYQEITVTHNSDWNFPNRVVKGKPLKIFFKHAYVDRLTCTPYQRTIGTDSFVVELTRNSTGSIINVKNVTDAMSTKWSCTLLEKYHGGNAYKFNNTKYSSFVKYFTLHVKGAQSVNLSINKLNLTTVETDRMEYDGEAWYSYADSESVDLVCSRPYTTSSLRLKYYNANGIQLFQTEVNKNRPLHFRAFLNSVHKNSYIECIYTTDDPEIDYHYRTTFIMKRLDLNARTDYIIMTVNGLRLVPMQSNTTETADLHYEYKFIEGEQLSITCEKSNKNTEGKLYYDLHPSAKAWQDSKGRIGIDLDTNHNTHNTTLSCGFDENDQKLFGRLLLLSELSNHAVRVFGLPPKNVLYEYTSAPQEWAIAYQYTVNETLRLTCVNKDYVSKQYKLQWKIDGKFMELNSTLSSSLALTTSINITLNEAHNGSKIQCISINKIEDHQDENKDIEKEVIILKLKTEVKHEIPDKRNDTKDLIIILVALVCVLFFILTAICIINWCKRDKRPKNTENAYKNLSNENNSPIPPYPSQWENQYEDINYNKTYEDVMLDNPAYSGSTRAFSALPNNRQSNTPTESHYTEIDDYFKPKIDCLEATWNSTENRHGKSLKEGSTGNVSDIGQENNTNDNKLGQINNDRPDLSTGSYANKPRCNKNNGQHTNNISLRPGYENIVTTKYGQSNGYENDVVNCENEFYG